MAKKPSVEKSDIIKSTVKKSKSLSSKLKKLSKKTVSSNESDSENDDLLPKSSTVSAVERKPVAKKFKKQMIEKIANAKTTDVKDVVVSKRMASLNASAMMAATYEVERQLDKCEAKMYRCSPGPEEHTATPPKKAKDIKDEVLEPKDVSIQQQSLSFEFANIMFLIIIIISLLFNLYQLKPVSKNVVIVQDTDVTITGVYVNSTLGSNQEAYCKMQYRVQSSVTEERLVRPIPQEPPKSYTPLNALSCMLPPGNESGE